MAKNKKNDKSLPANFVQKLEMWPVKNLKEYERNSRTHSKEQIAQIAASISEFGFNMPILAESSGDIIAGHGRLMAARLLELDEVPVLIADHMTENQKRMYIIADNKLALNAGWDDSILAAELLDFESLGLNPELTGFDALELDQLLEDYRLDEEDDQPEQEPAVPKIDEPPVTALGNVWICGNHRVLCGTPTKSENVKTILQGETPDLVIISTPADEVANINYKNYEKDFKEAALFIFKGNLFNNLPAGNEWIVWDKTRKGSDFSDCELAWTSIKGGIVSKYIGTREHDEEGPDIQDQKPAEVYEKILKRFPKKAPALELFGGIGNGLIAAEGTKKSYRFIELDAAAVDAAVINWQNETGLKAILEETGETFGHIYGKRRNA